MTDDTLPEDTGKPEPFVPVRFPVGEDGLTDLMRRFVEEVQVDWNYGQAAVRAGYSPNDCRNTGHKLMKDPRIRAAIKDRNKAAIVEQGVDKSWVLRKAVDAHNDAAKMEGLGAIDRRLKAIELIGRHRDVDAFRVNGGVIPDPTGGGGDWDLGRLDDDELATFQSLLAKITTDPDASPGGSGTASGGQGPASNDVEQGSDTPQV
jgi:hypothetical protein